MSMAWEPDHRSNFFFSPLAHLCAVTYITEILLNVTLSNQSTCLLTFQSSPTAQLIFYERTDQEGPKFSDYSITVVPDPQSLQVGKTAVVKQSFSLAKVPIRFPPLPLGGFSQVFKLSANMRLTSPASNIKVLYSVLVCKW